MPITRTEIATYAVSVFSTGQADQLAAAVHLFDASGRTLGFLRFYADGVPLGANEFRADLGYPLASYPFPRLAAVVDVLRNEKPAYFTWYDYTPVRCYGVIETSREPIGEQEGI